GRGGVDAPGRAPDAGQLGPVRAGGDDGRGGAASVEAEVYGPGTRARAGAGARAGVHRVRGSAPAMTFGFGRAPRPRRSAALALPTTHVMTEPISANQSVSTTRGMRPNCCAAQSTVMTTMAVAMPVIASRCSARRET